MLRPLLIFLLLSFFAVNIKDSVSQNIDSMYHRWVVYEYEKNGEKICYIAATPDKSDTSYTAERNPYIAITRYMSSRVEEVSVFAGYEYKLNSNVYLLIDNEQKKLFTDGDMAWAKSELDDKQIIDLMLQAKIVKIRSDSSIGNYSVDIYSMQGLTRAYSRMKDLCI